MLTVKITSFIAGLVVGVAYHAQIQPYVANAWQLFREWWSKPKV